MDVIIIAGGRGKRLGSLTNRHNKGALKFVNVPILLRVLDSLRDIPSINKICVVTGYQSSTIECVLEGIVKGQRTLITVIRGPKETVGMLQRIALAIPHVTCDPGALVMGIDSLVSSRVMKQFVTCVHTHLAEGRNELTLLCARDTSPAPTHYLVYEIEGRVIEHRSPQNANEQCVLRSVGVRYLPGSVLRSIQKDAPRWYGKNISPYITDLLSKGVPVRAVTMSEEWVHFGYLRDFGRAIADQS